MTKSRGRSRTPIGALVALELVLAACGSDSGSSDDTSDDTEVADTDAMETPPTESDPPADTGADPVEAPPPDTEPPSTEPPSTEPPSTEPVELTATARGVSADTIKIGYAYLDFQALKDQGFRAAGWSDQELQFQSVVDAINADGGINGRTLEVTYKAYTPLGTEIAEAVCLEMTEDQEVFAVIGGFLGPAEPANTCVARRQETVLVGGVQSDERLAQAVAPWVTSQPARTRQADALLALLDSEGMLEGAKVAVVAALVAEDIVADVVASMEGYGVPPEVVLQSDAAQGDIVAEDANWAVFAERIRGTDANTVLLVGSPSAGIRNIAAQGLDVDIWTLDQESLTALGNSVDLEDRRGVLAPAPLTGQALWDHETVQVCRDALAAAHPDIEVTDPDDLQEGEEDWTRGLTTGCRFLKLFEEIALETGPELTNEYFGATVIAMNQFVIPGQPFASNDSFALVELIDIGADGGLVQITEIQDITS